MKIIHCADLHLDSRMEANLPKEKAKLRKQEILDTYLRMVQYAEDNNVTAIMIAGDLFDSHNVRRSVKNAVLDSIVRHPEIIFYYLKGNHDTDDLTEPDNIPDNLKLFNDKWDTYNLSGKVSISGAEVNNDNAGTLYGELHLDVNRFNIVMLHGQIDEYEGRIPLKRLKGQGIDYLALGHIHSYRFDKLDARGNYCYCGCLEGRGFDECGPHGFVLLDIDEASGTYSTEFIPFAYRNIHKLMVDISGCNNNIDVCHRIQEAVYASKIDRNSLVEIVLTGHTDVDGDYDIGIICEKFRDEFYFVKVKDVSEVKIEYKDFLKDMSLKGEFVRSIMEDKELSENDKALIVKYGIKALMGELV